MTDYRGWYDKRDCNCNDNSGPLVIIPNHMTWIVTMWHFGADSSIIYWRKYFMLARKVAAQRTDAVYSKVNGRMVNIG